MTKKRRRALSEIFPEITTELQYPFIVPVTNNSNYESINRCFSNKKLAMREDKNNSDSESEPDQLNHLTINSLDWCPASDLGDFDSDDGDTKSTNLTSSFRNKSSTLRSS